ncbi:hypothetical protein BX666DRAFT_1898546 [Dichotomocladium elegans]|nr:hypothetical protein BX666DRAFT_1898546 [Dichotomocladium elegans]
MKHSYAWSKKGSPAVVKVPKTRGLTSTILGAIYRQGSEYNGRFRQARNVQEQLTYHG